MKGKAEVLNQIQDAFNSEPLSTSTELEAYYLNTALARTGDVYSDFVENFALQLEDCREVYLHKLFIGHPGCGKTTELYQLLKKEKKADFFVCMGRCDLELDLVDIEYTDILFFFLDLLVRRASELGMELDENLVEDIYAYWEEEIEMTEAVSVQAQTEIHSSAKAKAGLPGLLELMAQIKGVIKNSSDSRMQIRRKIVPKSGELIRKIEEVIENISAQCEQKNMRKVPLIILDGLDRVPLNQAKKIFRDNGSTFRALPIHFVTTFPIALTYTLEYGDILNYFPNPSKLPMIKLRNWERGQYTEGYEEGKNTMRQIIAKRANLSLFDEDALVELIDKTGGYIRDLFRCISNAAIRAQRRGSSSISIEDVAVVLNELESDINSRYSDADIPELKKIYEGEKFVSSSESITNLLQVCAVLEYNGKRWCDLHPLVEQWLKECNKI